MSDYIKREDAINAVMGEPTDAHYPSWYGEKLKALPAAPVREVVRGEWLWNDDNGQYYCSHCGAVSPREDQDGEYIDCPEFCHRCGADMRAEEGGVT